MEEGEKSTRYFYSLEKDGKPTKQYEHLLKIILTQFPLHVTFYLRLIFSTKPFTLLIISTPKLRELSLILQSHGFLTLIDNPVKTSYHPLNSSRP